MSQSSQKRDQEYCKMKRPLWIHIIWTVVITAMSLLLCYLSPWTYSGTYVADISKTLLALNGTLLALVVGFSSFYFSVLESRRQHAIERANEGAPSPAEPETICGSGGGTPSPEAERRHRDEVVREWMSMTMQYLVATYRKSMRAIAKLLVAISVTYGAFIFVSYWVYLYALALPLGVGLPVGVMNYAFSVSLLSPAVTVLDAIIMTYFLTSDVAGRSMERQLEIMQRPISTQMESAS